MVISKTYPNPPGYQALAYDPQLVLNRDIVGHQCLSTPLIQNALMNNRMGKVVPCPLGNLKGADLLKLSLIIADQVHFASLVVIVQHLICSDNRSLTNFQ